MYHRPRDADRRLDVFPFEGIANLCRAHIDEFGYFHYTHADQDLSRELALYRLGHESCQCLKDWQSWCDGAIQSDHYFVPIELRRLRLGLARRRRLPRLLIDPAWDVDHIGLTIVDILRSRGWPLIDTPGGWALLPTRDGADIAFGIIDGEDNGVGRLRRMGDRTAKQCYVGIFDYSFEAKLHVYFDVAGVSHNAALVRTPVGIARAVVLLEAYFMVALQARADRKLVDARRFQRCGLAASYRALKNNYH
jgi:hypothetical protein